MMELHRFKRGFKQWFDHIGNDNPIYLLLFAATKSFSH